MTTFTERLKVFKFVAGTVEYLQFMPENLCCDV